jgi:hypothetical protein
LIGLGRRGDSEEDEEVIMDRHAQFTETPQQKIEKPYANLRVCMLVK